MVFFTFYFIRLCSHSLHSFFLCWFLIKHNCVHLPFVHFSDPVRAAWEFFDFHMYHSFLFWGIKITASRELVFRLRLAAPNDTMCLFRACIFRARIRSCCWLVSGSQGRFLFISAILQYLSSGYRKCTPVYHHQNYIDRTALLFPNHRRLLFW